MLIGVYQLENQPLAVVWPSEEALKTWTIVQIVEQAVPAGVPYKIIDSSELPVDRTFRNAWEIDPALLTDGVGSESYELPAVGGNQ